jgi:hypothetical protein
MSVAAYTLQDDILKMAFQGIDPSWRTNGNLYISLHTADPGDGGNQTSNETSYTGYARVAVPHDNTGFTIASHVLKNAATITFGTDTAGTPTITYVAVGTASSGSGVLLAKMALTSPLVMAIGVTPQFAANDLIFTQV